MINALLFVLHQQDPGKACLKKRRLYTASARLLEDTVYLGNCLLLVFTTILQQFLTALRLA